ncbi:MAG: hypothetical protein CL579_11765 [Alteromonadaceae bacterium]|nr:hypothetical protein [Alteromonadaceae bacterium]
MRLMSFCLWLFSTTILSQPHLLRDSNQNILSNPNLAGTDAWYFPEIGLYDSSLSSINDASGSIKLTNAISTNSSNYDWVLSDSYPVIAGQQYTLSAKIYSDTFPAPVAATLIIFRKADGSWLENSISAIQSPSDKNTWQEMTTHFYVPEQAASAQVYSFMSQKLNEYTGNIWLDEFFLAEGISYALPASVKRPFNGQYTKVDSLGNISVLKSGVHTPFIPLCIHADNQRADWKIYSTQGFNCNMWAGSAQYIQKAKEAVSDFNPNGMMSGLQIASFMMPNHSHYANQSLLQSRIDDIENQNLQESLLLYYWDNEKEQIREWDVPKQMTTAIRDKNTGHPIYMLLDGEGITRKYASSQVNMVDMIGDYINVGRYRDSDGFITANNLEHQTSPVTFAQINYGSGLQFRAKIYAGLAKGARAFSVWRDDFKQTSEQAGAIENALWWHQLPQIRRELDQLQPLIKQAHWTDWRLGVSSKSIDYGTRNLAGLGYIILSNEHAEAIQTQVNLVDLPYDASKAINYLTGEPIANIDNGQFNVSLPAYGSLVIQLDKAVK